MIAGLSAGQFPATKRRVRPGENSLGPVLLNLFDHPAGRRVAVVIPDSLYCV
jgi:hypothetical protein